MDNLHVIHPKFPELAATQLGVQPPPPYVPEVPDDPFLPVPVAVVAEGDTWCNNHIRRLESWGFVGQRIAGQQEPGMWVNKSRDIHRIVVRAASTVLGDLTLRIPVTYSGHAFMTKTLMLRWNRSVNASLVVSPEHPASTLWTVTHKPTGRELNCAEFSAFLTMSLVSRPLGNPASPTAAVLEYDPTDWEVLQQAAETVRKFDDQSF